MIVRDADVIWRPGRIYIPAWSFAGLRFSALGSGQASSATISSATTASPSMRINLVGDSGYTGLLTSSMNDAVNHLMMVPYDLDVSKPVRVSIWWCANTTSITEAVTWLVTYVQMVANTTALDAPFVALDSAIGSDAHPVATALSLAKTPYGVINGNTINKNTEAIGWRVLLSTHDLAAQPTFLGMEVVYTPKRFYYQDGMRHEAKLNTNILGDVAAN